DSLKILKTSMFPFPDKSPDNPLPSFCIRKHNEDASIPHHPDNNPEFPYFDMFLFSVHIFHIQKSNQSSSTGLGRKIVKSFFVFLGSNGVDLFEQGEIYFTNQNDGGSRELSRERYVYINQTGTLLVLDCQ
ncbi:hypothetical protein WA026_017151, partial [Henosepilachna vigintioctopunctata]